MYNENNRKLRTILLVLAIVLVLLRIVKTAKAEESSLQPNDIFGFVRSYLTDAQYNTLIGLTSEYDNQHYFYDSVNHCLGFEFSNNPDAHCFVFNESVSPYTFSSAYYIAPADSDYPVVFGGISSSGCYCISRSSTHAINNPYYNLPSGMRSYAFSDVTIIPYPSSSFQITTAYGNITHYYTENYYKGLYGRTGSLYNYNISWFANNYEISLVSYTSDSRLKFWTFDNLDGSKTLVTDLSEFLQGSEGVMDNQISGLTLTYELDNIEHTLTLDSSNSVIRRSGTATTYRVETPFSAFGFDSSVTTFDITKCDFTLTYSAYGYTTSENYKISCDYSAYNQSSPVEPAPIPSPAVSDPTVDSSVYTFINTVYSSYSSDRFSRSGTWDVASSEPSDVSVFRTVDVYHFANDVHGSGVDESIYYYSLLDWSSTSLDITAYAVFDWDKFLSDNTSALYFDVISVPVYHFTPVGQSSTISGRVFDGYALFYTPSYFLRQQYGLLGDILTVVDQDAQNQYNNGIWIVDKINDFEDKTLDALNASLNIDTDSLSWLKTIDNSIKSLDFPVFDDSSILSGLASIVTALSGDNDDIGVNGRLDKLINFFIANDSQKNDSALAYRNWLDGLDSTETRRVTHFGTNIYSLVKNIFDIFDADYTENPSFENPDKDYLGIASDFIDALNNIDNSNKFFRGFFDSSFDPLEQSGLPEE